MNKSSRYLRWVLCWMMAGLCWRGVQAEPPEMTSSVQRITLEEAYNRVLKTDQSIQTAFLELQKARLLPWSALARIGPRLTGNAGYSNTQAAISTSSAFASSSSSLSNNRLDSGNADITYQQPLLDFTVFPAYRLGKLTTRANALQHRFISRETLFGVARAYYEILKQEKLLGVNQETLSLAEQQLDLAQKRFEVGEVTRTDVARARVAVETARRSVIESRRSAESARTALSNVLNLGVGTEFQVVEPAPLAWSGEVLERALNRALEQREDYAVSSLAVEQDVARRDEVLAQYGPTLVGQLRDRWATSSKSRSDTEWDATVAVQIPFFEGGQREIDLRTAEHQIRETRLNNEKQAKSIQEEVKNAWLQANTLRQTLGTLQAQVEAAEQNYRDLQAQYEAGAATSLDTLVALRDLNSARTDLNTQTYDFQVALRDLQRAVGEFQEQRLYGEAKPK